MQVNKFEPRIIIGRAILIYDRCVDWDKPTGIPKGVNDLNVGLKETPSPSVGKVKKWKLEH